MCAELGGNYHLRELKTVRALVRSCLGFHQNPQLKYDLGCGCGVRWGGGLSAYFSY